MRPTLSKRHDSRQQMTVLRNVPKEDTKQEAISPSAVQAALRVAHSLFFMASWMLVRAAFSELGVGAPPA